MRKTNHYDLVITTNCPAFYKINLYNEINTYIRVYVVFLGFSDDFIINDDFESKCQFEYSILSTGKLEKRSRIRTFFFLFSILKKIEYDKIIYAGYTYLELVILSFLKSKRMNVVETDSGLETALSGWRYFLKIILLKRYSLAIASGEIHVKMLRKMGFQAPVEISQGVGIINKRKSDHSQIMKTGNCDLKFLYVGRLISIKNLEFLINQFNRSKLLLTVVGTGVQERYLRDLAEDNISFVGFEDNDKLAEIYSLHHVFILPSLKEAWGLVVEEALYHGCVLMLSNRVGCLKELLLTPRTGVSFDPKSEESFEQALQDVIDNFQFYKKNVDRFDLDEKDIEQVASHVKLLNYQYK